MCITGDHLKVLKHAHMKATLCFFFSKPMKNKNVIFCCYYSAITFLLMQRASGPRTLVRSFIYSSIIGIGLVVAVYFAVTIHSFPAIISVFFSPSSLASKNRSVHTGYPHGHAVCSQPADNTACPGEVSCRTCVFLLALGNACLNSSPPGFWYQKFLKFPNWESARLGGGGGLL